MISRRGAALAVAGLVLGLVPASTIGAQTGAAASGSSSVTKSGTGRFSELKVTVGQTTSMRNQVVEVTWTGGAESAEGGGRFLGNYLQIMQCWGDGPVPLRENCQFGGIVDDRQGGNQTASRQVTGFEVDPKEALVPVPPKRVAVVPFVAVNGESTTSPKNEFFDAYSTNEIPYGRTSADGTGREFFEVQTAREAAGLGCGTRMADAVRNCWLVVVPRDDIEVSGKHIDELDDNRLNSSPLSASNFENAIAFRLDFEPLGVACPIGAQERRLLGHEPVSEAVVRWQPALCDEVGSIFGFSQLGDDLARGQVLTRTPWLSVVADPIDPELVRDGRELVYAPLSISGIGIAFNIERVPALEAPDSVRAQRGTRVLDLRLNARLLAKLLTQTYIGAVPGLSPHIAGNPQNLTSDPEFLGLNPEFKELEYGGRLHSVINPLGLADANRRLWEWIAADKDAAAFLAGRPDPWGTKVNPNYQGIDLLRADFPRSDPTCSKFPFSESNQADLCSLDWLAYAPDLQSGARAATRGQTLSNANWDVTSIPPRYKAVPPQVSGQRAVLALVDTANAERFRLPMARLENAAGAFVAPTLGAMSAALPAMREVGDTGVFKVDLKSKVPGAYPLTQISYAVTAPKFLTEVQASDYAGFLRFATTDGQTPGIGPGQLPEGYLPLTKKQRKQSAQAADVIAARGTPEPAPTPSPTPTTTPVDVNPTTPVPAGAGEGPAPSAAPQPVPATVPTVTPGTNALESVSTSTPGVPAGNSRFVLIIALALGLLVAGVRIGLPLVMRLVERTAPAP